MIVTETTLSDKQLSNTMHGISYFIICLLQHSPKNTAEQIMRKLVLMLHQHHQNLLLVERLLFIIRMLISNAEVGSRLDKLAIQNLLMLCFDYFEYDAFAIRSHSLALIGAIIDHLQLSSINFDQFCIQFPSLLQFFFKELENWQTSNRGK